MTENAIFELVSGEVTHKYWMEGYRYILHVLTFVSHNETHGRLSYCYRMVVNIGSNGLSRDGDLDLDAGLQADAGNLLDELAGGVQVDQTLVDLELITIPGLGTLTARSLASGDLEDLRGEADRALDTELLVLGAGDQVSRELLQVLDIAARERDTDFVDLGLGHRCARGVVFLFTLSDVTHPVCCWRVRW